MSMGTWLTGIHNDLQDTNDNTASFNDNHASYATLMGIMANDLLEDSNNRGWPSRQTLGELIATDIFFPHRHEGDRVRRGFLFRDSFLVFEEETEPPTGNYFADLRRGSTMRSTLAHQISTSTIMHAMYTSPSS